MKVGGYKSLNVTYLLQYQLVHSIQLVCSHDSNSLSHALTLHWHPFKNNLGRSLLIPVSLFAEVFLMISQELSFKISQELSLKISMELSLMISQELSIKISMELSLTSSQELSRIILLSYLGIQTQIRNCSSTTVAWIGNSIMCNP